MAPRFVTIEMTKPMLSVDEALAALLAGATPVAETEAVATLAATGRVLAADQFSAVNVPPLDNTSMDGYAVRAADCASGEARLRVNDRLVAILSVRGQLVQAVRTPPGLFATEVQPQSFGLGLSRNLLLVTFEERELAARGAA